MLDRPGRSAEEAARETTERWIGGFDAALASGQPGALSALFVADCHWRNLFGISWQFATFSGDAGVVARIAGCARGEVHAGHFRLDTAALAPRQAVVAGRDVIEAVFRFDTDNGPGCRRDPAAAQPGGAAQGLDDLDFARFRCDLRRHATRARREHLAYPRLRRSRLARAAREPRGL